MILLIDNYDSFTYNVYQYVGELHPHIEAARNDEITIEEIETMAPERLSFLRDRDILKPQESQKK